jgi:cytidylate kinase
VTISKNNKTCRTVFNSKPKIIAVDGPAGAGKSTVAKFLAKRLGYLYLDTGAMYRAVTLNAINSHVNFLDSKALVKSAKKSRINLERAKTGNLNVYLNGKLVNDSIRTPLVSSLVSFVARLKPVREVMVYSQRKIAGREDCVVEGRDIGTVVFPKAFVKFYLDASLVVRANRRCRELQNKNIKVSLKEINDSIERRDKCDISRKFGALKKAADAVYVDTSNLSINQVVDKLYNAVSSRRSGRNI